MKNNKKEYLYNLVDKEVLKEQLHKERFKRITLSFYRYVILENPQEFRDQLYRELNEINCFGRIYVAHEGINAQMSLPEENWDSFKQIMNSHPELKDMPLKILKRN